MSPGRFVEHRDELFRRCEAHGRDPGELILVNSTRVEVPDGGLDGAGAAAMTEQFRHYASLGVHHLQAGLDPRDEAAAIRGLAALGTEVLPAL